MASLDDFNETAQPTLEEFNISPKVVAPAVSKASNLNLAATAAAMSGNPEDIVTTYRAVNTEMELDGNSTTADEIVAKSQSKVAVDNKLALAGVLASPDYTDEQKNAYALSTLDANNKQYDVRNMLGVAAVKAPNGVDEEPRSENFRVDAGTVINSVNEFKTQEQAILNAEMVKENGPLLAQAADVLEIMVPFVEGKMAGEVLSRMRGGDGTAYAEAISLLGSSKMGIKEMLANTPIEERLALTQSVVNIINESSTIIMPDGNDFTRKMYLQDVLDQGSYDDVDKWIDNVSSVLDLTIIGGVFAKAAKATGTTTQLAGLKEKAANVVGNVQRRMVKSRVQPTTVSQVYKDTNSEKARATLATVVADDTGEAAQALYGASRDDAISNDILPEILNPDGTVMAKVGTPERNLELSDNTNFGEFGAASNDGAIYAFTAEKAQARAAVVSRFENVVGLSPRKEMFQVSTDGGRTNIRAVYGPTEGGFETAEDAMSMARWALRDEGVTDKQLTLLTRDGANYRTVTQEEMNALASKDIITGNASGITRKPKDFLVAVDHSSDFRVTDVTAWAEADVKYNIFDRLNLFTGKAGIGSLQRHIVDIASMANPAITKGALAAVDRTSGLEKELLDLGKTFADGFSKADKEIQVVMSNMVKEANLKGKEFSYSEMVAAGLRDTEIKAMKDWHKYWDTVYHLENKDAGVTLRNRGYKEYVDEQSDTRLFVKPLARTQVSGINKVYDPATDKIVRLTDAQVAELYFKEGTIAKLRSPVTVGDDAVEHIISDNKVGSNYLRGITDDTQVLNYRKGYYAVKYKDPYFVVQKVKNSRGEVLYERAVATAGSKIDANALAASKANNEGKILNDDYYVRGDLKGMDRSSDDHWDLQQVRGRSAQRTRGKRLEEADTNISDPTQSNILDPVDSMISAARSVASRTSMRGLLETTKARAVEQYKNFLPKGEWGQPVLPGKLEDIIYRGGGPEDAKKLGDAKTTFEYIKYLEDGYINHIDDGYKAVLKGIADIAGNAGAVKTDKSLRWMADGRGPSAMGKNIAFNLYLALNPLRQLIVQSHQAMQLVALHPRWIAGGEAMPQLTILMAKQLGMSIPPQLLKGAGLSADGAEIMYRQFQRTGQVAAIDKQNLVRGSLLNLADQMSLGKTVVGKSWQIASKPLVWSRQIGFDAGENINTMTAWLANRDTALRAGLNMADSGVQAEVAAKARNFTYGMNAAGDMPYNQNFLSAVFQFMQVPHKAMLTMTTNRILTPMQKLRLASFNAVMYTLPPAAMLSWFGEDGLDVLPEDPEARTGVIQGLEGYMLNKLLSLATGEKSTIDWSGLAPTDIHGTMDFVHGLFTTDAGAIIANTPSGQLLFGNNPRITNFAKSAARYFNLVDDYQDPTTFGQVAMDFAKLSSGFSNAYKAAYALKYAEKYGTLGGTTNSGIPTPNAIALVFGFQGLADAQNRYINDSLYQKSQDFEKDVKEMYKNTKAHLISQDPSIDSSEFAMKVTSEAWRVWGNENYKAKQFLNTELMRDLQDKDISLYNRIIRANGIMGVDELKGLIKDVPYENEEKRQRAIDSVDFMYNIKE